MAGRSIAINFAAMTDGTNDKPLNLCVGEKKHPVIANADAKAIPVLQFFAAGWKRVVFGCEDGLGNSHLHLPVPARQFLARIAGDFDLPAHALMPSSFIT